VGELDDDHLHAFLPLLLWRKNIRTSILALFVISIFVTSGCGSSAS